VFVPQITGGELPFPVTENVSVRQTVASLTFIPSFNGVKLPPAIVNDDIVKVFGPVMTKVLKSSLN